MNQDADDMALIEASGAKTPSQPATIAGTGGDSRRGRFTLLIPLAVLLAFFAYMWWVSGVVQSVQRFPDGRVKARGYVKRHGFGEYRRTGRWELFHENGAMAAEGAYENGEKTGPWRYWDSQGRELTGEPNREKSEGD